jgi:hypothetical protein
MYYQDFTLCTGVQYYDDAAGILRSIILSAIAPHRLATVPPQLPASPELEARDAALLAERQATEEPNFLPYAAIDSSDEADDRCGLLCSAVAKLTWTNALS